MKNILTILIISFMFTAPIFAQDNNENKRNDKGDEIFKEGFGFGIAIGLEHFENDYVNEAKTIGENRIVKVTDSQEWNTSLWIETHYTWDGLASRKLGFTHSAPGFFIAARVIGNNADVFDAFGFGLLWAFKRTALGSKTPAGQIAKSLNIGMGPIWHRTKTLASGIREGSPLPEEFDDIEYKREDEISWVVLISAGF